MRVLITGAGGFLGEHLVQSSLRAGHDVTATVSPGSTRSFPPGVSVLEIDLADGKKVRDVLPQFDGVIFAAGRNWQPGLKPDAYMRQNLAPVNAFFDALDACGRDIRVVFTSSMTTVAGSMERVVFDESGDRTAITTSRLSPYDKAKLACEQRARQSIAAGQNVVIVHPGYMIGPGASPHTVITTTFIMQWFVLGKDPATLRSGGHTYCDVRDVARAEVAALEKGERGNQYILGGENLTAAEFHVRMASQIGKRRPFRISGITMLGVMSLLDFVSFLSCGLWKNPVRREFARALPLHYWGDSSKAIRELDYRPRSLAESIRDTFADFVESKQIPEHYRWICSMNDENRLELLLFRQLADGHLHREVLLPQLPKILEACRQNLELNAALEEILGKVTFNPDKGKFQLGRADLKTSVKKLRGLLDYVYYSSNEFHTKVS